MSTIVKCPKPMTVSNGDREEFLKILPRIERAAIVAFRALQGDAHDDAVQEVTASAYVMFVSLVRRGKRDLVYASALARFAIKQLRTGRLVGNRCSVRDVLSRYAQKRKGIALKSIDRFRANEKECLNAALADGSWPIVDQVAFRLDFPAWLKTLSPRKRSLALYLAVGNSTHEAAREFEVSSARVSQVRRELRCSWFAFHGEENSRIAA